jgi:predicted  nucleic acid-binding Zn-ribbon protein
MAIQKLTKEELDSITNLQNDNAFVKQEFGKLSIDKIRLEQRELNLKSFLNEIGNREVELNKLIVEKYGQGTVDITKGEITTVDETVEVETQPIEEVDEDN